MSYEYKYKKYKIKYLELKNLNNQKGGNIKKCYIDDTDKILFGDGGSSAIIIITKDN